MTRTRWTWLCLTLLSLRLGACADDRANVTQCAPGKVLRDATCGVCLTDDDCGGAIPVCLWNVCVECDADGDCKGSTAGRTCDRNKHACGHCDVNTCTGSCFQDTCCQPKCVANNGESDGCGGHCGTCKPECPTWNSEDFEHSCSDGCGGSCPCSDGVGPSQYACFKGKCCFSSPPSNCGGLDSCGVFHPDLCTRPGYHCENGECTDENCVQQGGKCGHNEEHDCCKDMPFWHWTKGDGKMSCTCAKTCAAFGEGCQQDLDCCDGPCQRWVEGNALVGVCDTKGACTKQGHVCGDCCAGLVCKKTRSLLLEFCEPK